MNEIEKMLRDQLEEYLEKGDTMRTPEGLILEDKDMLLLSRKAEYVYKTFPLYNGGMNGEGNYENLHVLYPKGNTENVIENPERLKDGEIVMKSGKGVHLASKEVIKNDLERLISDLQFNKITEFKNEILRLFRGYMKQKLIDVIPSMIHPKNCSKCIHWNHGRMNWYCLKGYSTNIDDRYREIIPLAITKAVICAEYETYYKENYMKLIKVEEANKQ